MLAIFLSILEGVSVMTVIIDGVDVAPAGLVKRSSDSREPRSCPAGTRTRALEKAVRQSYQDRAEVAVPGSKKAAKAWAQFASTAGPHDRHFRVGCAHATLRFSLHRKRHNRFHPRRSFA